MKSVNAPLSKSYGSRAVVQAKRRVRWPVQPLSQLTGRQVSLASGMDTLFKRQDCPRSHAPHSPPHLCPTCSLPCLSHSLVAARDPDWAFHAGPARVRWGLPRRAYPTVWPPDAAARSRQEGRGQGRNLSQRAVPLTVGQASGQGQQGRARGRACKHPPPSILKAPAAKNRPLRAAAQEHKRAAGLRSARPHHTPCTHRATATRLLQAHRIQVSTGPSLTARAGRALHATTRSHRQPDT